MDYITLVSDDGVEFKIPSEIAFKSKTIESSMRVEMEEQRHIKLM